MAMLMKELEIKLSDRIEEAKWLFKDILKYTEEYYDAHPLSQNLINRIKEYLDNAS